MLYRNRGSTLLELLTIIGIIAVLAPILLCVFRQAKVGSNQVMCANNLKMLGLACEMYQADWSQTLVPYGAPFAYPPQGAYWVMLLEPYVRRIPGKELNGFSVGSVFKCPAATLDDAVTWSAERSLGMNVYCGGWLPGGAAVVVPLRKVRFPEATVRITDTSWPSSYSGTLFAPTPKPPLDSLTPPGRHGGLNNVLWIDGHVTAMTNAEYLLTDTYRDMSGYTGNVWCRLDGPKPLQ